MEKVDRLGWAAGFSFTNFGVKVGVRTNTPERLSQIGEHLPPASRFVLSKSVDLLYSFRFAPPPQRKGVRGYHLLYEEFIQQARTENPDELFTAFRQSLEYYVPQLAPRMVFVHSGVVGWKDRAILIPGRSFSGKSRMTAALVKAGATYYSDEFAVIDRAGRVHPYARPLSIRSEGETLGVPTPVSEIGGRVGRKPIEVAAVFALTFKDGAKWRPRGLPHGKGILELLANTVPARKRPAESLSALKQATQSAVFFKGNRGDADETAARILQLLDR